MGNALSTRDERFVLEPFSRNCAESARCSGHVRLPPRDRSSDTAAHPLRAGVVVRPVIRFASLGSGSAGNALLVENGETRLLVDCGFSVQETCARLARLGRTPDQIDALLITHEHSDHIGSSAAFARRHRLPVYMTPGTRMAARDPVYPACANSTPTTRHRNRQPRDPSIHRPHDAREPAQFVFSDGARKLALLTDAGHVTAHMAAKIDGADGLLLECNHDPLMLAQGPYPAALKQAGRRWLRPFAQSRSRALAILHRHAVCSTWWACISRSATTTRSSHARRWRRRWAAYRRKPRC
jgi:hypothetical protein